VQQHPLPDAEIDGGKTSLRPGHRVTHAERLIRLMA